MKCYLFLLFLVLASCSNSKSVENDSLFASRDVVRNLRTVWEIVWGPDNHIWLTERGGKISRVNPETGEIKTLVTISAVYESGERGLMGMALHPNFQANPYVYVVYNYQYLGDSKIRIERYTYDGNVLTSPTILLENIKGASVHDGARIAVGSDNKLWFTIGDASDADNAQDLTNVNGKINRMNLDGSVPDDNPFPGSMIWSYGHRNQQGLVIANNKVYTSEHGAGTDDEINIILKGRNYGWPEVEGYCDNDDEEKFCTDNNIVEPILSLTPDNTLAIAGIDYYNHNLFSDWKNSILITALKTQMLVVARLDEAGEKIVSHSEYFREQFGRLRDVCVAPDGRIFLATSNRDGRAPSKFRDSMDKIIEIKPKSSTGLNNNPVNFEMNIFPNPSFDSFTFNFSNYSALSPILVISDAMGRILKKIDIIGKSFTWDGIDEKGNKCPTGIYNVSVNTNSKTFNSKLVLIR